jgi:excisionase family DNA binding protein
LPQHGVSASKPNNIGPGQLPRQGRRMSEPLRRRAWTPKEVSQQLGVPYETVLDLIHKGKVRAVTAGRYYLIPDFEIERFLQSKEST